MNRSWTDFKSLHSNIAGAREAFEDTCETLFREINLGKHVSQMKVKAGDGGIDIFIGEFGIEPITVIQCKFFLESFEESQKSQIRDSFDTAIKSDKYELKEWILCIPRIIDIDENSWWFKWKHKKLTEYSKDTNFIKLTNGNELIDLLKINNLYNRIFKIDEATKINEIHSILFPKKTEIPQEINPKVVLFNNYSKESELFYFERAVDKEFIGSLKISNLWVFGDSGFGKTALVNRNLTKSEIDYCFCDLSPVNITNAEQVIEEILCKAEETFEMERNSLIPNKIKQLTQLLCKTGKRKIIIVIDELSVTEDTILKDIARSLMNLVIHYSNSTNEEGLKFVVSTISNPKDIIENKSKASEYFQYINCNDWSRDIENLFEILTISLNISIPEHKSRILKSCEDSPRILKSIFRKILSLEKLDTATIEKAIQTTTSELVR